MPDIEGEKVRSLTAPSGSKSLVIRSPVSAQVRPAGDTEVAALLERASIAGVAMLNDGWGVLKKGQHFGLKVRVGVGSHSKLARRRGKPGRGGGGAQRGGAETFASAQSLREGSDYAYIGAGRR